MSTSYITDTTPAGGFEKLAISTTVVTPTAAKILVNSTVGFNKRAVKAFLTVETNSIRLTFDGSTPDSNTGHLLAAGDSVTIQGEGNVANIKIIRSSADGTVQITYFYSN